MEEQVASDTGTAVLDPGSPMHHPDVWGKQEGCYLEEIRPGESWFQWQLETHYKWIGEESATMVGYAIFGELLSPAMPEKRLSALRWLACGEWDQTDISTQARLGELFLFPQRAEDIADIETIADALFYVKKCHWEGAPRESDALPSDVIAAVSDVLVRRWRGAKLSENEAAHNAERMLATPVYVTEWTDAMAGSRVNLGITLGVHIQRTLKKSDDAAADLGFLREITDKERAVLQSFVKNNSLRGNWPSLSDVVGKLTPERLLTLATLVEEYNVEWAMAAMEWDPAPVTSKR